LSPVRPHRQNGFLRGLEALLPGTHKAYDYDEVFIT
jgi:hypothetical protein